MLNWPLLGFVAALHLVAAGPVEPGKQVVGWVEKAVVNPGNLVMNAKVDTGADNTSIDARDITETYSDGKKVLRFVVDDRNGKSVTLEREQVGIEVVPRHQEEDAERPLIIMKICLGNECRDTIVNLADRSRQKYPLLIGRSFMLDRVIVDTAAQYTVEPKEPPAAEK